MAELQHAQMNWRKILWLEPPASAGVLWQSLHHEDHRSEDMQGDLTNNGHERLSKSMPWLQIVNLEVLDTVGYHKGSAELQAKQAEQVRLQHRTLNQPRARPPKVEP